MTQLTQPESEAEAEAPESGRDLALRLVDRLGAAALGGLIAGFLVGGIGGRLAMLILRLTSDPGVRGIQSDDDFTIGQFSSATVFLVVITTVVGAVLAFGYLVVRRWLPEAHRPLQAATFFGLIGGAAVIKPDGVDFTLLDPLPLAVAFFIALPAAYGAVMASIVEWLVNHPGRARKTRVAAVIPVGAVGLLGGLGLGIAVIAGLAVLIGRRWPAAAVAVTHPVPTWIVRIALIAIAVVSANGLITDTVEIL